MNRKLLVTIQLTLLTLLVGILATASPTGATTEEWGSQVSQSEPQPQPPPTGGGKAEPLAPVGTGFSYQGQLKDGGSPANGQYDFVFKVYSASGGGVQVGQTYTVTGRPVTDGLFTTFLDPGTGVFNGEARYLEISVRPFGGGGFTTLSPRQALTASPYALGLVPRVVVEGAVGNDEILTLRNTSPTGGGLGIETNGGFGLFSLNTNGPAADFSGNSSTQAVHVYNGSPNNNSITLKGLSYAGTGLFGEGGRYGVRGNGYGDGIGVYGTSADIGVKGEGQDAGVQGINMTPSGIAGHFINYLGPAVVGETPGNYAVRGVTTNTTGVSIVGTSLNGTGGLFSTSAGQIALQALNTGTNGTGIRAEANTGTTAKAVDAQSNFGTAIRGYGSVGFGVVGQSDTGTGVSGVANGGATAKGVSGTSNSGTGVAGNSTTGDGVTGTSTSGRGGYFTSDGTALWGESSSTTGVYGVGPLKGVQGNSEDGDGVAGYSDNGFGVYGQSTTGTGVRGTGSANGVHGNSTNGTGVYGTSEGGDGMLGSSVTGNGVWGTSSSGNGGYFTSDSGDAMVASSEDGAAVVGDSVNSYGGVFNSTNHTGVRGSSESNYGGEFSSVSFPGAKGESQDGEGLVGSSVNNLGVSGYSQNDHGGSFETASSTSAGVKGVGPLIGVLGTSTDGTAVEGNSQNGNGGVFISTNATGAYGYGAVNGLLGVSTTNTGVRGESTNGYGGYFQSNTGTGAYATGTTNGLLGVSNSGNGVRGQSTNGYGVYGTSPDGYGVYGTSTDGSGVRGISTNGAGVVGQSESGFAGFFNGRVEVTGDLTVTGYIHKLGGGFVIDHPLDPANKYLNHSFVESPDMKNIYDGNVTTDAKGEATVLLPDYFEAVNKDYRYQLTPVGQFAQAIVSSEIKDNRFTIKTDKPNVKVSWQVTGIRKDVYAEQNRIQVEVDKSQQDKGKYLHPREWGQPVTKAIGYVESQKSLPKEQSKPREQRQRVGGR
jgi:hypothetical protein